jgi:hypothetical protein
MRLAETALSGSRWTFQLGEKSPDVIEGLTVGGLVELDTRDGAGDGVAVGEAVHRRAVDVELPPGFGGRHLGHEGGNVGERDVGVQCPVAHQ